MRIVLATALLVAAAHSASAAPQPLDCSRSGEPDLCRQAQAQYQAERKNAGDYGPMRNAAFCLWTGCDGAFRVNRKEACQIRRQIMKRHARQVDRSDEQHFANCVQAGL